LAGGRRGLRAADLEKRKLELGQGVADWSDLLRGGALE
jgi:hypothetical protein